MSSGVCLSGHWRSLYWLGWYEREMKMDKKEWWPVVIVVVGSAFVSVPFVEMIYWGYTGSAIGAHPFWLSAVCFFLGSGMISVVEG